MFRTIAVAGMLLALGACATADLAPAIPAPALISNYKSEGERVLRSGLRDPSSAQFDYRDPAYRLECDRGVFGAAKQEVWAAEVWVNAKNGYGGFTGPQPYTMLFIPDADGGTSIRVNHGLGGGRITAMSGICRRVT